MLLPATVLSPLHWLHVHPVAVYNLTLLGAFVASGVAACLLVTHLTESFAAGLLGGVIFAFSPHRLEHFDHLELQFAFWIPLAVLAWHRAVARNRGYLAVGALAAGQVLSSIYHGMFLLLWLAVVTAVRLHATPRRAVQAGALILAVPLLVMALYSVPYMRSRADVGERGPAEVAGYSAVPTDFLSAPRNSLLYGWTAWLGANERHLFPGVVALALLIVGLWPPLDRDADGARRGPGARARSHARIQWRLVSPVVCLGAAVPRLAGACARRHPRPAGNRRDRRLRPDADHAHHSPATSRGSGEPGGRDRRVRRVPGGAPADPSADQHLGLVRLRSGTAPARSFSNGP